MNGQDQLREEIFNMIIRYGKESDITVYQALGVLEVLKFELIELLEKQ